MTAKSTLLEPEGWHPVNGRFCDAPNGNAKGHVENLAKPAQPT